MKKLLLLLLLIPMLTFGAETVNVRMPDGTILKNVPKDITKQEALDIYDKQKAAAKKIAAEKIAAEKIAAEKIAAENKRKLRIETKCANKSSKSSNEFSARQVYQNCLENNNYWKK